VWIAPVTAQLMMTFFCWNMLVSFVVTFRAVGQVQLAARALTSSGTAAKRSASSP